MKRGKWDTGMSNFLQTCQGSKDLMSDYDNAGIT